MYKELEMEQEERCIKNWRTGDGAAMKEEIREIEKRIRDSRD